MNIVNDTNLSKPELIQQYNLAMEQIARLAANNGKLQSEADGWRKTAERSKSTLAEKDKELVSLRNDVVILNEALAVKHIPQLNAIMVRNTEIDQLRTDAATKDKTIGELRACLGECVQALKGWHDYFQKDIATTADQQHEQGEQFTDAWFNAESAIAKSTSILSTQSDKGGVKGE